MSLDTSLIYFIWLSNLRSTVMELLYNETNNVNLRIIQEHRVALSGLSLHELQLQPNIHNIV